MEIFKKKSASFPWLLGLVTGGLLLLGSIVFLSAKNSDSKIQLEDLTVAATQKNLTVAIRASGTVEPIQSVNISPKNPGILEELLVEQGDKVESGQILAIMENDQLEAQKLQAEANLNEAKSALELAKITLPAEIQQAQSRLAQAQATLKQAQERIPTDIQQAQAQLQSAEARFKLAEERIKRNQYLVDEGAVAQDRFDEVFNEFRNAQASLSEAQERLAQVTNTQQPELDQLQAAVTEAQLFFTQKQQSLTAEIAKLEATVAASQAQLANVLVQYQDTIIKAPFSGIVTQKYATVGAFVTPTTSASTTASATSSSILALAQGLEIVAKIPEIDLSQLANNQRVEIVADAYPDQVFEGKVKRIAPEAVVENNVTSFEVVIELLSGENVLRSKMNVDVTFLGNQINNALVVPTVAIVTQEGKTGVMIPDSRNQPLFQPVTIGLTLDNQTQIIDGLNSGQLVFIDLPN